MHIFPLKRLTAILIISTINQARLAGQELPFTYQIIGILDQVFVICPNQESVITFLQVWKIIQQANRFY